MSVQFWSENIVVVDLPREPFLGDELQSTVDEICYDVCNDVVLDFSEVEMITSSSIAKLLKLRKILTQHDKRMVICKVGTRTLNIFRLTGLLEVFQFASDKTVALASLQIEYDRSSRR